MERPRVLIVDDNPEHLKIYGLILEQAGYEAVPCLARRSGIELPDDMGIRLAILDYTLNCEVSTAEIAKRARAKYTSAPILLLSDIFGTPVEMTSLLDGFVRKGDPRRLLATIANLIGDRVPEEHSS